jgi:catechol 2,3-dioxygenase-like lactoylglutathione lyase family enzyme/diadenosine tetraphosphate (Ap4A) HIT family hydrolase
VQIQDALKVSTAIHRRVDALRKGADPTFIARLASGWAVMGDPQLLPGYCLLLPDPVVGHLNELGGGGRSRFLADVAALGDAVLAATGALRINYAVFGNLEPALHAHVIPRYANEPEAQRALQPWALDWSAAPPFGPVAHGDLRDRIHAALGRAGRVGAPGRVHHLDLTVEDLAAATAFYEGVLPLMGFRRLPDAPEGPIWRGDMVEVGLQAARRPRAHDRYAPGLHHLAFEAPSPRDVDRVYQQLRALGVRILDAPAEYPSYGAGYYAVFFADGDGIKLEYAFTP